MASPLQAATTLLAMDGHIYMGLGSSFSGDLGDWWDYDMATDSWSKTRPLCLPGTTPTNLDRRHRLHGFGTAEDIFNTWYAYDPSTETWSDMAELPAKDAWRARFSHNGLGFALSGDGETQLDGGRVSGAQPRNRRLVTWPSHPDGPAGPRRRLSSTTWCTSCKAPPTPTRTSTWPPITSSA